MVVEIIMIAGISGTRIETPKRADYSYLPVDLLSGMMALGLKIAEELRQDQTCADDTWDRTSTP